MENSIELSNKQEISDKQDIEKYELPTLLGTDDYTPTILQCQLLLTFINDNEDNLSPGKVLKRIGHHYSQWYMWKKHKPKFIIWWNQCLNSAFTGEHLTTVWNAVYRRACENSPQDAKLFVERHDKAYKPTTAQEQRHTFAGYVPNESAKELAERSRARERRRIESKETTGDGTNYSGVDDSTNSDNTEDIQ